jgi:hypothetical protein
MNPGWARFVLPALLLVPVAALAQDEEAAAAARRAQAAEEARQAEAQRRAALQEKAIRDKSIADMNLFLTDSFRYRTVPVGPQAELQSRFFEFRQSIPKFRAATDDYRRQVGMEGKLEKPLKELATQTDVMLRYLKLSKMKHPDVDTSEFKDYKPAELVWETLNAAERVSTFLPLAVEVEKQDVVSPPMLEFMYKLNGELLRLKWLVTHTKDTKG